jgi:RNA polymerase sigma factor (sigma-70 family)
MTPAELAERFRPAAINMAMQMADRRDMTTDEFVSDAMLGLMRAAHRYDARRKPTADKMKNPDRHFWAFALPAIRGQIREEFRRRPAFERSHLPLQDVPIDPEYVAKLALKRCGVIMLEALPPRYRKLMLLRYWHQLSNAETAREMGVSPCRVSQIEKLACKIIAAELERRGIRSLRDVV